MILKDVSDFMVLFSAPRACLRHREAPHADSAPSRAIWRALDGSAWAGNFAVSRQPRSKATQNVGCFGCLNHFLLIGLYNVLNLPPFLQRHQEKSQILFNLKNAFEPRMGATGHYIRMFGGYHPRQRQGLFSGCEVFREDAENSTRDGCAPHGNWGAHAA
jgi:hypothetical protein